MPRRKTITGLRRELDVSREVGLNFYNGKRLGEAMPQVVAKCKLWRYFDHIVNHCDGINPQQNSFYVFSEFNHSFFPRGLRIIGHKYFTVAPSVPSVFYEGRRTPTVTDDPDGLGVIKIVVNGMPAGYYVPSLNSLWTTDWTHAFESITALQELFPQLVEELNMPQLRGDAGFEEYIGATKNSKWKTHRVTVGCDPEFEMITPDGSEVVRAESFIDGEIEGLGVDGAGSQVELRPRYDIKPHNVIKNMRQLFEKFNQEHQGYVLGIEGNHHPLGGHIHIGIEGGRFDPPKGMLSMLDDFLGRRMEHMNGSARGSYATLSAYESKPWGFEYRSIPAAPFLKPDICRITLKIAKNVCERFLNSGAIIYNNPPGMADYMRIGGISQKEWRRFVDFLQGYDEEQKVASAFWTKVTAPKHPMVNFVFSDDWNLSIKEDLNNALKNVLKQVVAKDKAIKKKNRRITVIVYGLRSERGSVNTIPLPGYDLLVKADDGSDSHLKSGFRNGTLSIGLSSDIRTQVTDYVNVRDDLIKAIKGEIVCVLSQ